MTKKMMELPKCACGGQPFRFKDRKGLYGICCKGCDKATGRHSRTTDATKEWLRIYEKPAKTPPPQKKAEGKPAKMVPCKRTRERIADGIAKTACKSGPCKDTRMAMLRKVALVSCLAKRLSVAADELGRVVCEAFGATEDEVRTAAREGVDEGFCGDKREDTIELTANVVSGEAAKRLVAALAAAGVPLPDEVVAKAKAPKKGAKR